MRNYINTIQGGNLRSLSSLPIDNTIREKKGSKGFLSYMYVHFIELYGEDTSSSRLKWEKDLECNFEQDTWEHIRESASSVSFNSRHRLMQFNIIHRVYPSASGYSERWNGTPSYKRNEKGRKSFTYLPVYRICHFNSVSL